MRKLELRKGTNLRKQKISLKKPARFNLWWVRLKGLEPSRRGTPDPKSGASANSATGAGCIAAVHRFIWALPLPLCGCKGSVFC